MAQRSHPEFSWVTNKSSLDCFADFMRSNIRLDAHGLRLWDVDLGDFASDCVALQSAGFLARYSRSLQQPNDYSALAASLISSIHSRKKEKDWFAIPYNAIVGSVGEVDLAEFGASSFALREFHDSSIHPLAQELSTAIVEMVLAHRDKDDSGRFRKSASAPKEMDVLNADLYAAFALSTGFIFEQSTELREDVEKTIRHLITRFGKEKEDRWVYSENHLSGETILGYSAAYQATIVGWGWLLANDLSNTVRDDWINTLLDGYLALRIDVAVGPTENTESARWAKDWRNVWEIRLALCLEDGLQPSDRGLDKINGVTIETIDDIRDAFHVVTPTTPGHRCVSSPLRKVANFCSIISALDHIRRTPEFFELE